jgi:hypothetical protein
MKMLLTKGGLDISAGGLGSVATQNIYQFLGADHQFVIDERQYAFRSTYHRIMEYYLKFDNWTKRSPELLTTIEREEMQN